MFTRNRLVRRAETPPLMLDVADAGGTRAPAHAPGRRSATGAFDFLNRWADRVFVITLERASDRQARVRERLRGVRFQFARGIDKRHLDRAALVRDRVYDEAATRWPYRHKADMSLGEIGAALSHRRLYEDMVRNRWRRVVVFEDDVVPLASKLERLPDALAELPAGWDLCYLGYFKGEHLTPLRRLKLASYVALSRVGLCPWKPHEVPRLPSAPYSPNLRRAGLHTHAHAYAVSLEGAKKLLAAQNPIAFRADALFSWLVLQGKLAAYVAACKHFEQERVLGLTPRETVDSYIIAP